jgi:hypothetical protein
MTGQGGSHALTVRLDADLHERLRAASFKQRVPMSDLIRDALDKALPHVEVGCDVCGARPFKVWMPGGFRFCDEHQGGTR